MTNSLKSFGQQAMIYGTGNVLTRLVTFLLLPLLTNVLSVEEYGMVALVYVFLGFMNIVFHYGIDSAFLRFAGETDDPTKLRNRFSTAFWLSVFYQRSSLTPDSFSLPSAYTNFSGFS